MRIKSLLATAILLALAAPAMAQAPIKIALIQDKTGPLEAYAKQMVTGFRMGIEFATHGTNMVAGRKIEIIEKDSQFKPDLGRTLLAEAYGDDKVDFAVGGSGSAVALAMLPVAQEEKKLLIVSPAVADSITGDKWNRYIFRTSRDRQAWRGDRDLGPGLCVRPRRGCRFQAGAGRHRRKAGA